MIRIKDLTVSYHEKVVLDSINIDLPSGGITVILGKNGSGKSVLLKTISGLIDHYKGSIIINSVDLRDFCQARDNDYNPDNSEISMAYVFQKGGLFDSMTVFDNVAFALRRKGIDEAGIRDIVMESLQKVGLSGNEVKLPSELSGGMQKRVGLARAICLKPNIILYDDPTAGLDPILSDAIADLMIEISETYNTTSVVATHDLKVAGKISDSILLLYRGGIAFNGSTLDFFKADNKIAAQFIEGDIEGPIDIF